MRGRHLRRPVDDTQARTAFVGLLGTFVIYGLSLAVLYLWPGTTGTFVSIGLTIVAIVFGVAWFLAVRGGFRFGKGPNRLETRAKAKKAREQEKLRQLRLRR